MSDTEEKVVPASPRKREEARKRGQVSRSADLSAAVALLASVAVLHAVLPSAGASLIQYARHMFDFRMQEAPHLGESVPAMQWDAVRICAVIVLPVALAAMVCALCAGIGQVGFSIAPEALSPRWERISPAEGAKRLFSRRAAFELLKNLGKVAVVGVVAFFVLRGNWESGVIAGLMGLALPDALQEMGSLIWNLGIWAGFALLVIGGADFAFQRYDHERGLRMSESEAKRDRRESGGDPQTQAQVRRARRAAAQGRRK